MLVSNPLAVPLCFNFLCFENRTTHYSRTTTKPVTSRNTIKTILHTIRWSLKVSLLQQFARKIILNSSWRPLTWQNKTNRVSQNTTNHLLHTSRSAHQFCSFFHVSLWFANTVKATKIIYILPSLSIWILIEYGNTISGISKKNWENYFTGIIYIQLPGLFVRNLCFSAGAFLPLQ